MGNIFYDEMNFTENPESFKGDIGYIPQKTTLFEDLSLYESLKYAFHLMNQTIKKETIKKRIREMLSILEIEYAENTLIRNLSGGEKKEHPLP